MKKFFLVGLVMLMSALSVHSQNYSDKRYYNPRTGRFEYATKQNSWNLFDTSNKYYGLRLGLSFGTVNSDDKALNGGSSRTGLTFGAVMGYFLSQNTPVILETGLLYNEKGGRSIYEGKKMSYNLNYLQIPIVVKYAHVMQGRFSIQPFLGGYIAHGIGGKIKNYGDRVAEKSFSKHFFKRFDGGLRMGCGLGYDIFYADITYDLGLANISHDEFDTSRTRCLSINCGVNF